MAFQIRNITPGSRAGQDAINGPLTDLNKDNFTYNIYQYPIIQQPDSPDLGHNLLFYINLPERSYWNTESLVPPNGPPPVANRNALATRFGLRNVGELGSSFQTGNLGSLPNILYPSYTPMQIANFVLEKKQKRTNTAISLYIPNTMLFSQNMEYENISITNSLGMPGSVGYAGAQALNGSIGQAVASAGSFLEFVPLAQYTNISHVLDIVRQQGFNLADNPQNLVLFKQIDFRQFQFDFLLTPENADEANNIQQIIYLFRFHSAPEVASGSLGRFFVPPSTFDIEILHNGQLNSYLPKISTCVCESVNVDYAASGEWVTHYDGSPKQIRLTLNFKEIEIMTKDRIEQGF